MSENEGIADALRAVADVALAAVGDPQQDAAALRVMLAQTVGALRTAAAAWPSEPAKPPRPPAYRGDGVERVQRARGLGDVTQRQTLADALDDAHETGRRLGFEQGLAKGQEYTAAAELFDRASAELRGDLPRVEQPAGVRAFSIVDPSTGEAATVSHAIGKAAAHASEVWLGRHGPINAAGVGEAEPLVANALDLLAQAFRV